MTTLFTTETRSHSQKKMSLVLYLTVSLCLCGSMVSAKPPVVPPTQPLEIQVPKFDVKPLSCGMTLLFLKNDDLPLVQVNLLMPGGNIDDPVGKEGLVGLMSSLLRNGGTEKMTPEEFDEALEDRAASMEAGSEMEDNTAGFKCLAKDLPDMLPLFADMLRHPRFDPKRFETDKAESLDGLHRLEDTPDALTRVLFYRTLLANSFYGRWDSPKTLGGITREDVVKFYNEHYGPPGSVMAITGKFNEEQTAFQLDRLFAGWNGQKTSTAGQDPQPLGPTIYFFPKDVTQVFVRWGVLGLKRHDVRQVPLDVANYVLGGSGFTSRLMGEIRSNRGLAYFIDSVSMPYNVPGIFEVIGGTRPDSVKEYLDTMFKVMGDYAKQGPSEQELSEAKQSMVEEFAYNFESPYSLAPYKASLDFHGYPADYLENYREKVKAVTRDQATEAARSILEQKNWVMVVCGPSDLEKELEGFGKVVTVKSIFDPL